MTLSSIDEYGPQFQTKVISSLLTHKDFLINIYDILDPEMFGKDAHKWIIKEISSYYQKYHTSPSMDVLKTEIKKISNEVLQIAVKEQLREAYKASIEDTEYVQEEFSTFCKNQQLKKALLSSVDLLKAGDYDSIKSMIENAMKAGQDKNIGHEYNKDIESRYRIDQRNPVPCPWIEINDLLQGGLGIGDFGLIFGNPGGGKSWALVALGGFAVENGYNVFHYTLELSEDYVGRRYDAFFTRTPVNKILENRDRVENIIPNLPGQLIIKEFPTGKATINTVESHIKKVISLGVQPDLIIIDYVDLLSSKDDVIEGDKAAGSYDKMMITDVAISLSRKKDDKVNGTGRFHIMKNRYGMDGITYKLSADTSTGHFEILEAYDEDEPTQPQSKNTNFDDLDRKMLQKQFFELNT
jgi:replicative DNA helicase